MDLITVDGRLDEPSWVEAPVVDDIFRMNPSRGHAPLSPQMKVVYDARSIYSTVAIAASKGIPGSPIIRGTVAMSTAHVSKPCC